VDNLKINSCKISDHFAKIKAAEMQQDSSHDQLK